MGLLIVVCHLPPGFVSIGEQTGFASINTEIKGIESDPRIVEMVRSYNERIELAFDDDALQVERSEHFSKEILKFFPAANVRDVDFLEIVEIPENWEYTIVQGRSGIEELVIWEKGSKTPHIFNPEA
jgi:hypothetical protein